MESNPWATREETKSLSKIPSVGIHGNPTNHPKVFV